VLTVDHFLHHVPFAALRGPDQRALVERFPLTTRQRYGDPVRWAPFTAVGLP